MILEECNYDKKALFNKTVLITGGAGGIGLEASRAFSYMGANVIIADSNADRGKQARVLINGEQHSGNVDFYQIDISEEMQIDMLYEYIVSKYERLDVLINNAAVVPMGAIEAVPISDWDLSYGVNLRAPVLLAQRFLPSMKKTGGVIVFIPSAAATPYMSAYEIFKTAQVELCNTLCEEIAGTGVITYSIAPGFVKTDTAVRSVEIVASSLGITTDDFYKSLEEIITDAEVAGGGYAVSVVHARLYHGKEIMSYQVLMEHGLISENKEEVAGMRESAEYDTLSMLFTTMADVFYDQYQNWQNKKLFQKQFIYSDFKKQMNLPAESFKLHLETLQNQIDRNKWDSFWDNRELFIRWRLYYEHQIKLLQGYEKDKVQLASDTELLKSWITTLQKIIDILQEP